MADSILTRQDTQGSGDQLLRLFANPFQSQVSCQYLWLTRAFTDKSSDPNQRLLGLPKSVPRSLGCSRSTLLPAPTSP